MSERIVQRKEETSKAPVRGSVGRRTWPTFCCAGWRRSPKLCSNAHRPAASFNPVLGRNPQRSLSFTDAVPSQGLLQSKRAL